MTYKDMLRIAMEQSAEDLGCNTEDFKRSDNVVVPIRLGKNARKYLKLPITANLVSYGNNVVAGVTDDVEDIVKEYIDNFLNVYYRKMTKSERLTKDEWMRNRRLTKDYSFSAERRQEKRDILGKILRWMQEWSGTSYVGYNVVYFIRHTLFQRFYYPLFVERHRKKA